MTKGKYYIDKRCTNIGGSKNYQIAQLKKRFFIIYQRTKVQKLDSPKNEKAEKT